MHYAIAERKTQVDISREALARDLILYLCTEEKISYLDSSGVRRETSFAEVLQDTVTDEFAIAVNERFPFVSTDFFYSYKADQAEFCLITLALRSELQSAAAKARLVRSTKFQVKIYEHFLDVCECIASDLKELL